MIKILLKKYRSFVSATALTVVVALTGCNSTPSDKVNDVTDADKANVQTVADTKAMTEGEQANANFKDKLSGTELLNALKQGGHVIYIRHTQPAFLTNEKKSFK